MFFSSSIVLCKFGIQKTLRQVLPYDFYPINKCQFQFEIS